MLRLFLTIFGTFLVANSVAALSLGVLLERLSASPGVHLSADAFFILQFLGIASMGVARLMGRQPGSGMGRPILSLLMIWNVLIALPTAALFSIWAVAWRLISGPFVDATALSSGARTTGLAFAAVPFAVTFFATAFSLWQLQRFHVRRVKLAIPNLPPALKGFTIVHLSDFHVGRLTYGKVLSDIVAETNRLNADLILLTGDLINMAMEDLPGALEMLRGMKSRYGLFSCEGNHDLIESRHKFEVAIKLSGLNFLLNESATISVGRQPVQIIGLRWGEGMSLGYEKPGSVPDDLLPRLVADRLPDAFTILLAHHPEVFDAAAQAGIPLTLAGHTHGGQLMLTGKTGFGPWLYRYWSGIYERGSSRLVVSNGVGNWFPLRINAPAEIIHLTLE